MQEHHLPTTQRGVLLDVRRSSAYYQPVSVCERDAVLMRGMETRAAEHNESPRVVL